jgi:hypothetical protein
MSTFEPRKTIKFQAFKRNFNGLIRRERDKKYLKVRRVDKRATFTEKGGDGEKS